ncbi:MAG: hypothetical protein PHD60_11105 [Clostridia bacterium]|nr:hypothetical protein [Clostridia bacterium]
MNEGYFVKIKTQYELEYKDNERLVKVTVDDLREPTPMVILSKFLDLDGIHVLNKPSKEVQLIICTRISEFLKQQGYSKIYTEEFGEI